MPLEDLRILTETTASQRAFPESESTRRRRDEAIRFAARRHSPDQIADFARLPISEVLLVLDPAGAATDSAPNPRPGAAGIKARYRSSTA
jgi:hypothetical protein